MWPREALDGVCFLRASSAGARAVPRRPDTRRGSVRRQRAGQVFLAALPRLLVLFVVALSALMSDAKVAVGYWPLQLLTVAVAIGALRAIAWVVWVLHRLLPASGD
jgi:hypothetical protein